MSEQHRQNEHAEPVIERPDLPPMTDKPAPAKKFAGQIRLMDDAPGAAAEGRQMPPVPAELHNGPHPGEYPPQQPHEHLLAAAPSGEGYLRLLLRVDDGQMSLVDLARVDGPLAQTGPVHGGLAYEVTLGREPLAAGAVPDPGVRRGLAPQDAPEKGHSIVEVPSFEFTARVPAHRVGAGNLADLDVAVYRMDATRPVRPTADQPLRAQVGRAAEEVAVLRGIRVEELDAGLRSRIDRSLR